MSRTFQGRPIVAGAATAPAVVTRNGMNTLATFQKSLLDKAKEVVCADQNNPDIFNKVLTARALCLPKTIGSTTGGMVLHSACSMGLGPAMMLFSESIDSLAAAGAILAAVWSPAKMVTIDNLGPEFLEYVKDGMTISTSEDGTVTVV